MQTHYQTLGLGEQATADDIRRAYRRLVLLTHPDRTTDPDAHRRFLQVNEAYDVLSNPARRQGYDALLTALRQPPRPATSPSPAAAPNGQPRPATRFRRRSAAPPSVDLRAYQTPIRWWGKVLAAFALLIVLDYTLFQHTVLAHLIGAEASRDNRGSLYTDLYTNQGTFRTYADLPSTLPHLQVRESAVFRLVSQVYLPDGSLLPVRLEHRSLFIFTVLLLSLALLLQRTSLHDATRVNVGILATVVGCILLLMILL